MVKTLVTSNYDSDITHRLDVSRDLHVSAIQNQEDVDRSIDRELEQAIRNK